MSDGFRFCEEKQTRSEKKSPTGLDGVPARLVLSGKALYDHARIMEPEHSLKLTFRRNQLSRCLHPLNQLLRV